MNVVESFADYSVALSHVPLPGPWTRRARCRQAPQVVFFPGRGEDPAAAKEICARCPVIADCRTYVLDHPGLKGVWGGLSAADRKELRRIVPVPDLPETPGERNPAGIRYRLLEQLTAHPGRWARIAHYATTHSAAATASQLRTGRLPAPAGRWQFEGRASVLGGSDLYARFEEAVG